MSPDEAEGGVAEAISTAEVRALLTSDFWFCIAGGGPTGSTNDDALALALAGAPEGTVVLASAQHAGRGRFDRAWDSPGGGVYFSAVLRPGAPASEFGGLPLAVGLGVARGLERLGVAVRLKWPNDVLLGGRKVAGVLVESRIAGVSMGVDQEVLLVAGVGLNVVRPEGPTLAPGAGFLRDELADVTRTAAAAAVLDGVAEAYRGYVAEGFAGLRDQYRQRSDTLFQEVTVSDANGALLACGEALDIDADGRLLVRTTGGVVALASGDVTLRT